MGKTIELVQYNILVLVGVLGSAAHRWCPTLMGFWGCWHTLHLCICGSMKKAFTEYLLVLVLVQVYPIKVLIIDPGSCNMLLSWFAVHSDPSHCILPITPIACA